MGTLYPRAVHQSPVSRSVPDVFRVFLGIPDRCPRKTSNPRVAQRLRKIASERRVFDLR